jgi:hypothetical protein
VYPCASDPSCSDIDAIEAMGMTKNARRKAIPGRDSR